MVSKNIDIDFEKILIISIFKVLIFFFFFLQKILIQILIFFAKNIDFNIDLVGLFFGHNFKKKINVSGSLWFRDQGRCVADPLKQGEPL